MTKPFVVQDLLLWLCFQKFNQENIGDWRGGNELGIIKHSSNAWLKDKFQYIENNKLKTMRK